MCLAVLQTKGAFDGRMVRKEFFKAFKEHPDGFGLAYFHATQGLIIEKPYYSARDAWAAYRDAQHKAKKDAPMLLHFRWATSGCHDYINTHPHRLETSDGSSCVLAHNGVLDGGDRHYSDTVQWVETVFWGRSQETLFGADFEAQLDHWIASNRIVLLAGNQEWKILNESLGFWREGTWYSNDSAFRPRMGFRPVVHVQDEEEDNPRHWYDRWVRPGAPGEVENPAWKTPALGYIPPEEEEEPDPVREHEKAFDWWARTTRAEEMEEKA